MEYPAIVPPPPRRSRPTDIRADPGAPRGGRSTLRAVVSEPGRPVMALRTAAVAGLCGVALLTARVAEATGVLEDGALGELASRLDVAASVLIVVVLAAAWRPLAAGRLTGTPHVGWTWS